MTEAEWARGTRTNPMLRFLIGTEGRVQDVTEFPACKGSDRKLRLFACACYRRISTVLPLQPEPAALTGVPARPGCDSKRLRVLVVEDNRDAADSLQMLLEVFGYEVSVAYTGPDGVAAAKEMRPDAVVCDIGLPGLSGYEVARALRRHPATAKARMIAVTGYGGEDDRRQSREAGFDAHLTKPADPTALQELLAHTGSPV
jgi:CheY-like chemotaxis protein